VRGRYEETVVVEFRLGVCCVLECVGVLLVVSVGVALGVFVGGVLLVAAARYFKRLTH